MGVTDEDLLLQTETGDASTAAALFDRYSDLIFAIGLRVLRDRARPRIWCRKCSLRWSRKFRDSIPQRGHGGLGLSRLRIVGRLIDAPISPGAAFTTVQILNDSGPIDEILTAWEMFSNLRYLRKPVELFVIPDIQHGVHILPNPTVDWFCFWLKGEGDPNPAKAEQ
jgi:hypothetical protein